MEAVETVQITVLIAGRPYPLKVKAEDEQTVRRIVKEINQKINHFQLTYKQKDKQDCLSMTLLTYAVDLHKAQRTHIDEQLSEQINRLHNLLDTTSSERI